MSSSSQEAVVRAVLSGYQLHAEIDPTTEDLAPFRDGIGNTFVQSRASSGPDVVVDRGGRVDLGQLDESLSGFFWQLRPVLSPWPDYPNGAPDAFVCDSFSIGFLNPRRVPAADLMKSGETWDPGEQIQRVVPGFYTRGGQHMGTFRSRAQSDLEALRRASPADVDW